jgi:hypothetical protein
MAAMQQDAGMKMAVFWDVAPCSLVDIAVTTLFVLNVYKRI